MTPEQMKSWIDNASFEELLSKWRNPPVGSPWFQDEIGDYYYEAMKRKRAETPPGEQVAASKAIGW